MGSGDLWRCEPAASASVCREGACAHAAPGATRPRPPGRQAAPLSPPPPAPPAGPGGRLGGGRQTASEKTDVNKPEPAVHYSCLRGVKPGACW